MPATAAGRCQAAHETDRSPCEGPQDAVTIVDSQGGTTTACVLHGARVLASLQGARVYPGSVDGAAIEVFNRAQDLVPFSWMS